MEAFLIYQLKVAILVTVLVLLYRVFLEKQTFHRFNRIMLLLIVVLSVTLPFVHVKALQMHPNQRHIATSLIAVSPVDGLAEPALESTPRQPLPAANKTPFWIIILAAVYCVGLMLFIVRYTKSLKSVARLIDEGNYADRRDGCDVIESSSVSQPLNWMRYVVMPRQWLESADESMAWKHEHLHASRFHSLDLLLADLLWGMQWFNPAMKLFHSEIELIHEFEADRAVLESGTDAVSYKLMLVGAVAQKNGISMGNWLKKSKLKNRIDMMERKESSRWNMLRALFIPVIAFAFLFADAQTASAQDENFHWPIFEDGKVWLFKDGTAKVQTFDNVTASMKADEIAGYLKKHEGYKTTRMTLMYMYPIESLAEAQPLAEQLAKVGIHINVANNEDMLDHMTMPEFRLVRIYGPEAGGQYRFEMICNLHEDRITHRMNGKPYTYKDLSISGDVSLMLKWIDLFDGHGLAIYPSENMPCADLQKFAEAAWDRGIEQVSVVQSDKGIITLIPQGTKMTREFGNVTTVKAVDRMNASHTEFRNAEVIKRPKYSYNPNPARNIVKIVRTADRTVIVENVQQGPDLWLRSGINNGIIRCNGNEYHQTGKYGLEGFDQKYFWSPDWGKYVLVDYFPALPADAEVVDLCDAEGTPIIRNLQVSNSLPENFYDQFVSMKFGVTYLLKTLPKGVQDGGGDHFSVEEIEFSDSRTTVHCDMVLAQPHSFKGYINDFKLILPDGTEIMPTRVDGVPVGEEFYRGGDFVATHFELVFPKLETALFSGSEGAVVLTGDVCHEPVSVTFGIQPESIADYFEDGIDRLDIESYVNALDSFTTVMPYIGGDTESEWAADSIHVMVRSILDGNMGYYETMCRIYWIQDYLAYGMSYPVAIMGLRNDSVIARYMLSVPAQTNDLFEAIAQDGFNDLNSIRWMGLNSLANIQLYFRLYDKFKETFHEKPIYSTVNLGQYSYYNDLIEKLEPEGRPQHDIQKMYAALEGALFFNTFSPLILASAPSREYALSIYDFIIEAADFFDAHADPLHAEKPEPMSDSEYKEFMTKATEYKTAMLRMLTQEIDSREQHSDMK